MKPAVRYTLWTLMWCGVVAVVVYAAMLRDAVRGKMVIQRVEVEVADSSALGYLVTADKVLEWIAKEGIKTEGEQIDRVETQRIERLIERDGFVQRAVAYVTSDGTLSIRLAQRDPVFRLLGDGRNAYVTKDAFTFLAPPSTSVYVPVVTGTYQPPFPRDYSGCVRAEIDRQISDLSLRISHLEKSKRPHYQWMLNYRDSMRQERRRFIKRRWWMAETEEEFEQRIVSLRDEKKQNRRRFRYMRNLYQDSVQHITHRQESHRREQKKLEKNYEDFIKLLTFVEYVENDAFWRSEVVQIVAHSTPAGSLEVDLVPRSGKFTIRFGRLDGVERKFDRLARFYRQGLSRIGWDAFRSIDVRYDNQVICKR